MRVAPNPPGHWVKRKPRLWWYVKGNKVLGFVRQSFNTWDAYVATGKKWPESEKSVHFYLGELDNPFYAARRAVEQHLGYFREDTA